MFQKPKFATYNHGVLFICETKTEKSSFSAPKNPTESGDIRRLQKLDFSTVNKRERDQQFAESEGKRLDLKVKTRYHRAATTGRQALIGKVLYDIFQIDYDADHTGMFLFLEEVRRLQ